MMQFAYVLCSLIVVLPSLAFAADSANTASAAPYNLHYQLTTITQYHPAFRAAYTGANSMRPDEDTQMSLTTTLFFGLRLWKGAEFYLNPEISGGSGLSGGTGMAGYPNGEAFRIGSPKPVLYVARAYLKQVIPLGTAAENTPPVTGTSRPELFGGAKEGANQLGSPMGSVEAVPRLTIIAGKFGVADFYDGDSYAHDPRTQFMNWSLMSGGAWDYPADTRGYTWGIATELALTNHFDIRAVATLVPTTANGLEMDTQIFKGAIGTGLEAEYRFNHGTDAGNGDAGNGDAGNGDAGNGDAGKELETTLRGLLFYNLANSGTFRRAIAEAQTTGDTPDITATRRYGTAKYGALVSAERAISANVGAFMRASWSDGATETWAFTQIDHSLAAGVQFSGVLWGRRNDVIGVAAVGNGLAEPHRDYLAAGGLGFIIGDGALSYAPEIIAETYYRFQVNEWLQLSADYQFAVNPAYNSARGPVHVFSVRAHMEL
jgi:high affinity Mn2+ porin